MKLQKTLRNLLVGGLTALTLVATVACSGATDAIDSTVPALPATEQVSNVGDSVGASPDSNVTSGDFGTFASVPDLVDGSGIATETGDSIQAAFGGDKTDDIVGDALPETVVLAILPEALYEI